IPHPLDVPVAERYELAGPVGASLVCVLSMSMDDFALQSARTLIGVKAAQQQVGRIQVDAQTAAVEAVEELAQDVSRFQASLQREHRTGTIAVLSERQQRLGQEPGPRILAFFGNAAGLHKDDARSQVKAEAQYLPDVVDASFQTHGGVQAVPQRTTEGS